MTPRVATVLSAREWESGFVALARETASVRLVLRAYQPDEIAHHRDEIDVVVAGAETSWVTPAQIASWRRSGLTVIGVYPAGDEPARANLDAGGVHEAVPDDAPLSAILQTVRLARPSLNPQAPEETGTIVTVVGPRGAPGRTEIALALAWNWADRARTLLIDLDLEAPTLAVRTGRPPRPDIADAVDTVRTTGRLQEDTLHRYGPLSLVVGSHRPGEPPLRSALVDDVVEAAAAEFATTVVDVGPVDATSPLIKRADHAVVVAEASAQGLVRVSRLLAGWSGPPPALIVNRVPNGNAADVLKAARRWTGLDPIAVIGERKRIRRASLEATPPAWGLRKRLAHLEPAS